MPKIDELDNLTDHERGHVEEIGREVIRVCLGAMISHPGCVQPHMVTTALVSAALHFWRIAPGEGTMRRGLERIRQATDDFIAQGEAGLWQELDADGKVQQRDKMIHDFMTAVAERYGPDELLEMSVRLARQYGIGVPRQ